MSQTGSITRASFLKAVTAGGVAALLHPPSVAAAAAAVSAPTTGVTRGANERFQQKKDRCRAMLTLDYRLDDGAQLADVTRWITQNGIVSDSYLTGDFIASFEQKIANLLGMEAACWMPTGTMAQLIALRLYADGTDTRQIGWHPSSHHLLHEKDAYSHVHNLQSAVISPWERPIQASDVENAPHVAAVSVEIPVRWIGQTQTWSELKAVKAMAAKRDIPLIMDGARLWESQPFYHQSYKDICKGFDSVYVSFYKMIGAPGGAMLVGREAFIEDARLWRHRLGGNIFQNLPYIAAAAMRLDEVLEKLPTHHRRAVKLGHMLAADERLIVMPTPPQTNLFRVFLPGAPDELAARRDAIAERTGIWVGSYFRAARVPGLTQVELQIGEGLDAIDEEEAANAFRQLLIAG